MLEENLKNIGYFKYLNSNKLIVECVREYPITDEIINYIKKGGNFKYEYEGEKLKLINNKLVILI